jgi:ribosomal protein S21
MDMVKTLLESESVETALEKFKKEYLQAERSLPGVV